jgi:hypothetical protein
LSNLKEYHINLVRFKKRLILRTVSIFLINLLLLGWTVWTAPKENILNYLWVCSLLLIAIGLFLNQNFKRQIAILKNNYLEINNHILQWYTGNGQCTTVNLKRVTKIERDNYRGFERFLVFEGDTPYSILNLKEPNEFQAEIESITKIKVEIFRLDWKSKIIKGFGFFLPAMISAVFTYLKYLDIRYFFLILTVNSIFFLVQFSEKRTRAGFSESTVRRSTIILFSLLAYQILILVSE